jgi:hypothetical protein
MIVRIPLFYYIVPIACLVGLVYPVVAAPVDSPAEDTYWQSHSLVFATIAGTTEMKGDKPTSVLSLRPKLRLSGTLDPGKVPELSARIDPTIYGMKFKMPATGDVVLVVLVRNDKEYAVSPDRPVFMPGDRAPIRVVRDFDDPIVLDTLHAVQELRKKAKLPKKDGDSPHK